MNRFAKVVGGVVILAAVALALDDSAAPNPSAAVPAPTPGVDAKSSPEEEGFRLLLPPVGNPLAAARIEKRVFGVIPNHRAEQETAEYKPLKTWEKFKIAERDTFDWPNFPLMAGFALQTQIAEHGWHGKAMGRNFAEYYVRSFADGLIGNFITEAAMPSLLHEDPRFFRSGVGSVWRRTYKAARQVVVTRTENGKQRFNFSEVLGNSTVIAITSAYYPESRRLGPAAERLGLQIGNDVISNLMTEFWPDVKRRLQPMLHRHHPLD